MSRSRAFTFTLNNWTEDERSSLRLIDHDYLVYGREVGDNGTPHLQGYIHFKNPRSFTAVKKLIPRAHIEVARGTGQHNFTYCTKQDADYIEIGERPKDPADSGRKEKERWADAFECAREGNIDDIPGDIKLRFWSSIKCIQKDHMVAQPDLEDVCGIWYWGVPGSGKSHKARQDFPDFYSKLCNKWWCGYQGHENVIIDDFEKTSECLGHQLKIWADKYAFIAETKFGAINIRPKRLVITSNYSIQEIFGADPVMASAIARRFKVTHFGVPFKKDMQHMLKEDGQTQEIIEEDVKAPQEEPKSPYQEALDNADFQKGDTGCYYRKTPVR